MFQDLPHPVPPLAYLRYKENYFFIVIDPDRSVFGVIHCNFEPGFDRARFSCNMDVRGTVHRYGNQVAFPKDFAGATTFGDDRLRVTIDPSCSRFALRFDGETIAFDIVFDRRMEAFDFSACRYAAPDMVSFQEAMTLGFNLPFEHMQQSMTVAGTLTLRDTGETLAVGGIGYRDHSWCVRSDNLGAQHTWCGLNFPTRAFGVMTIDTLHRPGVTAREGYVADARGARPLRRIEVVSEGGQGDGLPATVIHRLTDIEGVDYVIESDIAGRLGQVPLDAERPDSDAVYRIKENFCRSRLVGTGEDGLSLIELGRAGRVGDGGW